MEWIIPLVVVLFVFVLIAQKLNSGASSQSEGDHRYRRRQTLFTAAERSFLGVLDSIIDPQQHRIFGMVRVADLIEPEPSRNRSQWQKAFNRIQSKHFDFVICKADDLTPVCAIELDDASHKQSKRQQRDEMLEAICKQVGMPLVRVPAKRGYQKAEVENLILAALGDVDRKEILPAESESNSEIELGAATR
ncbi:DUF2726 domain-containing protein [Marinobacterium sp. D7]|uniref:DUF2726 domain-containing protein n=1 Tax=Marinobacterium ramblicola TaxID=2849041 RepID=UPI001C2CCE57|nr:DUF2726 domain-containing protein [Marinobacterium ramblicola]MBV1789036.1 DUF2726 domain-containing protein [Marinobacterium ramblicola]